LYGAQRADVAGLGAWTTNREFGIAKIFKRGNLDLANKAGIQWMSD
jgi:hypothetical protein